MSQLNWWLSWTFLGAATILYGLSLSTSCGETVKEVSEGLNLPKVKVTKIGTVLDSITLNVGCISLP